MYLVDAGTLEVRLGDKVLHHLKGGDLFGESSLLFRRPRISTIECSSAECHLHEMKSSDFYDMIEADPGSARALRELCRTRMFQRATIKAFHDADTDNSGRNLFKNMGNSEIPEEDVLEYFKSLDLDEDG